jgi:hypothetical protein
LERTPEIEQHTVKASRGMTTFGEATRIVYDLHVSITGGKKKMHGVPETELQLHSGLTTLVRTSESRFVRS